MVLPPPPPVLPHGGRLLLMVPAFRPSSRLFLGRVGQDPASRRVLARVRLGEEAPVRAVTPSPSPLLLVRTTADLCRHCRPSPAPKLCSRQPHPQRQQQQQQRTGLLGRQTVDKACSRRQSRRRKRRGRLPRRQRRTEAETRSPPRPRQRRRRPLPRRCLSCRRQPCRQNLSLRL